MAQNDLVIANQSFPSFRSDLNSALAAIQTTHSGTSLPTGAVAGQIWLDTTSATSPTLKIYDGTDSISLAIIDYTTNTVNWLDSSLSYNSTATSAGTLVLTVSSSYKQYFTGTTTHTVTLPVASTLTVGQTFEIHNNSTGSITVNSSGSNLVGTVEANVTAQCTCILASGTTAASWDFDVTGFTSALPTTRGGTGLTTIGTSLQVLRTNSGATALEFATLSTGATSWQSVKTSGFTAVSGEGYPCNTTSSAFTVTLPASPSVGSYVQIVDYAGTFATNNITLGANSNKINGVVANKLLTTNREAVTITYVDSTQGWVASSGTNFGSQSLDPVPYSVDFLVVAGGGGGGVYGGGGGGAGGYRTSTQTVSAGTVITVTVGDGGTGSASMSNVGGSGTASSISGSGLTTISSAGGGGGASHTIGTAGSGGSGGGGADVSPYTGGAGNTPSTSPSQGFSGGTGVDIADLTDGGGGGGGASAVGGNASSGVQGGNGGAGSASSITGSSVTYAGGGGGGTGSSCSGNSSGGSGGGGAGGKGAAGTAGTANTGGGGGGTGANNSTGGANGGKGVVILSMPDASYSGTTTGSPTVATGVSGKTVLTFTGTGSYTT